MLNPPILPYLNGISQPTFSVKAIKCQLCTPTEGAQSTEELWALRGVIPHGSKLPAKNGLFGVSFLVAQSYQQKMGSSGSRSTICL